MHLQYVLNPSKRMTETEKQLASLFEKWSGEEAVNIILLPASGSDRRYYRISGRYATAIGAWNSDISENKAFVTFSDHFSNLGLPVPEVFLTDPSGTYYIQTDLGDTTLFSRLTEAGLTENVCNIYRQVARILPHFQINGKNNLDFSVCFPRAAFDRQSMFWDLNYFKYYFVRLAGITFDEQALEDDFNTLTDFLLEAPADFFLYRDFQSRNIMLVGNKPYFIDFQGGRKGPLQYDIASLLYDAKANLPESFRAELLETYMNAVAGIMPFDRSTFLRHYYGFVLIRILQALGTYGFRGFYQKKEHFLQSIPFALDNLQYLLNNHHPETAFPELENLLRKFTKSETLRAYAKPTLKVRICSFSYKSGIPEDESGNGGGFVFDCRALPNPGRNEEYKTLNGNDSSVKLFLSSKPETSIFLSGVYTLADQAVENYLSRGFENLMISFGCTGGQHRSVYCAEQLAAHLNQKYRMNITAEHTHQDFWPV